MIQARKIDLSTMSLPAQTGTVLQDINEISNNMTIISEHKGFIVGKAIVPDNCNGAAAYIQIGGYFVAGIPYCGTGVNNLQIAFSAPVNVGTELKMNVSNGGKFQAVRIVKSNW